MPNENRNRPPATFKGLLRKIAREASINYDPEFLSDLQGMPESEIVSKLEEAIDGLGGGGGATELSDLTDVTSATPTNRFALMANGTTFSARAIVEADISDLGTYLENVVEDTTPQLGGDLDSNGNSLLMDRDNSFIRWGADVFGASSSAYMVMFDNTTHSDLYIRNWTSSGEIFLQADSNVWINTNSTTLTLDTDTLQNNADTINLSAWVTTRTRNDEQFYNLAVDAAGDLMMVRANRLGYTGNTAAQHMYIEHHEGTVQEVSGVTTIENMNRANGNFNTNSQFWFMEGEEVTLYFADAVTITHGVATFDSGVGPRYYYGFVLPGATNYSVTAGEYIRFVFHNDTWVFLSSNLGASGSGGASQLSDLTDVNTSTPTNRNVLVADGVDWESRALVEADISDLQSYMLTLSSDNATPTFGAEWASGGFAGHMGDNTELYFGASDDVYLAYYTGTPDIFWIDNTGGGDMRIRTSNDLQLIAGNNVELNGTTIDLQTDTYFSFIFGGSPTNIIGLDSTGLAVTIPYGKGGTVASAANLNLAHTNGDVWDITGTTTINTIGVSGIVEGHTMTLHFEGAATVAHATAGTLTQLRLKDATNWTAAVGDNITLQYRDSLWYEVARTESGITYGITDVVQDTTPTLGGALDANNNSIINIDDIEIQGHSYADGEVDNGNSGTADTIDWTAGNFQLSTLTGNCTYTFTAPTGPTTLILRVVQSAGSNTVVWPGTVVWASGTAPTLSTGAGDIDLISFYWNGTNYYGAAMLDMV